MIGKIIGPYEVTASIGRGGMGEVFKAHDKKLGRDVALKLLPATLSQDTERLQRFEREARVLASLQHQNIAMMYGLEEYEGQPVIAMELAAGEDLSVRLLRGALPANEIEKIAHQLASGLEFAHEKGIVHRDLKPANVKVSGEGEVKILDFGLARAVTAEGGAPDSDESASYQPTITQALTGVGAVLGTAAYMSPEQARGYEVDRRCDIWAFGAILYEMMTSDRLFQGKTVADTLAAVLHKEPDWDALEGEHSPLLVQLCRRCLEKDANQRLRDIGEARVALEGSASSVIGLATSALTGDLSAPKAPAKSGGPWWLVAVLGLALIAALFAGQQGVLGPKPQPSPLIRSTVALPPNVTVNLFPAGPGQGVISPNGRYICFVGVDSLETKQLMIHDLETGEFKNLDDTTGASFPFWSFNSQEVAFASNRHLMRKAINGGPSIVVVPAVNLKGGSWNQFGQIIYAPTHVSSIFMISVGGGESVELTGLDHDEGYRSHRMPQWLPDGKSFQYTAVAESGENTRGNFDCMARVVEVATGKSTDLLSTQSSVLIAHNHLLYVQDSLLMARPIDLKTMTVGNAGQALLSDVGIIKGAHLSVFSANESNLLIYSTQPGAQGLQQMVRYDQSGQEIEKIGVPSIAFGLDVSGSGRYICFGRVDRQSGTLNTWIIDNQRNFSQQLTFGDDTKWMGIFSPDEQFIVVSYYQNRETDGLYRVPLARGGDLEPITVGVGSFYPTSFSPDGNHVYGAVLDSLANTWLVRTELQTKETTRLHPTAKHSETGAAVSPDGKWLVYSSDESGQWEIFIEGIDQTEGRWRISTAGGSFPRWSPQGDLVYYENPNSELVAVPISYAGGNVVLSPSRVVLTGVNSSLLRSYTIDNSTGDILVYRKINGGEMRQMKLVVGWDGLFKDK